MIDKELEVGDCIYLPYVKLEKYIENPIFFSHDKDDAKPFLNDTDVNGNLYLMIVEIAPWGAITIMELINNHGTLTNICSQFIKECGVFVKHKEVETYKKIYNFDNEVASIEITIPKDEAEDVNRVNVLDAMAESKTKALTEDSVQTKSIDDKIDKAIDARLSASEEKMKADVENMNAIRKELANNQDDKVSHPSHYTWLKGLCGIEVIDITRHMDFDLGNCVKYLLRAGHKKEEGYTDKEKALEDLKKAAWYLNDKIKMLEDEQELYRD